MHEVERLPVAETLQIRHDGFGRQFLAERDERLQTEHRVVEVACSRTVREAAVGIEMPSDEVRHEGGRFTEQLRRQPRDLQHLQPNAHCTSP